MKPKILGIILIALMICIGQEVKANIPVVPKNDPSFAVARLKAAYDMLRSEPDVCVEELFTSTDYLEAFTKVWQLDSMHSDELGYFNFDHWFMTQDDPIYTTMSIENVVMASSDRDFVEVTVSLTYKFSDEYEPQVDYIIFPMVFERGEWYIDDFITLEEDGERCSEKASLLQYYNNGGQWGNNGDE